MCDIKVGIEVGGSFSINMWILLLMSKYYNFAWSCEIDEFEHVWGSQSFLISHCLLARMYVALHIQALVLKVPSTSVISDILRRFCTVFETTIIESKDFLWQSKNHRLETINCGSKGSKAFQVYFDDAKDSSQESRVKQVSRIKSQASFKNQRVVQLRINIQI